MKRGVPLLVAALLLPLAPLARASGDALRERAEAGGVEAQVQLGQRLLLGRGGTEKDPVEAALWFGRAAEQGDARAQLNLASAYDKGEGVEQDDVKAVNWLMRAADQGHPRAMSLLAERFWDGRGVPKSALLAHMWASRAAAQGSMVGQVRRNQYKTGLAPEELEASRRLAVMQRERTRRAVVRGN